MTHPIEFKVWLSSQENVGAPFDRHILACAVALAYCDPLRAVDVGLGLSRDAVMDMAARHFPHAAALLNQRLSDGDGARALSLEEPDLRGLLLAHRSTGTPEEEWLAHIIARRAMEPNHLWQDLGLPERAELSELMNRHFHPLAIKNQRDMKWKKFFYRELCGLEGLQLCKSPVCDQCSDFIDCFGGEDGISLLAQANHAIAPLSKGEPSC